MTIILSELRNIAFQECHVDWACHTKGISKGRRDDLVNGGLVRSSGGWTVVKTLRLLKTHTGGLSNPAVPNGRPSLIGYLIVTIPSKYMIDTNYKS